LTLKNVLSSDEIFATSLLFVKDLEREYKKFSRIQREVTSFSYYIAIWEASIPLSHFIGRLLQRQLELQSTIQL